MTADLLSEKLSLQRELDRLLQEAQRNEEKMRRFDRLERRLIGAGSLVELVGLLLCEYRDAFGLDFVSLILVDRDQEIAGALGLPGSPDDASHGAEPPALDDLQLITSAARLEALYGNARHPRLGRFDPALHAGLFDCAPDAVASLALLPLARQGELIGSLHFGSASADRYTSDIGTDFLERLSAVAAICLESALARERLKQAGLTDALTGVQNRRYFEHRCLVEISEARRYRHSLACLFLDIDRFKRINDAHGHASGDEVLRQVANSIQAQLRAGDTVARYGGEEFVVLLPRSECHHACQIAERIRQSVERQVFPVVSGQALKVTVSIGVAMLPAKDPDAASGKCDLAESLVTAADKALYEAKHGGRNCVKCAATPGEAAPTLPARIYQALMARISERSRRVR